MYFRRDFARRVVPRIIVGLQATLRCDTNHPRMNLPQNSQLSAIKRMSPMKGTKRIFSVLFAVLLLLNVITSANKPSIFRTIDLNAGRTITLGEEFSKVEDLFVKADSGHRLKPRTFGGAKSITVYLTRANRIESIYFEYGSSVSFSEPLGSYIMLLGKPSGKSVLEARSIQVEVVL